MVVSMPYWAAVSFLRLDLRQRRCLVGCVNALLGGCIVSTVSSHNPEKYSVSNMSFDNNCQNILKKPFLRADFGFFKIRSP